MIVYLFRYVLHVVTPLAKRLRAFIHIRLILTEYRLATKVNQYLNHQLAEKALELEKRIEAAQQRERDARRILVSVKAWANQQIANTTRLYGFDDELDAIAASNEKNLFLLHGRKHSVKPRNLMKKAAK